MADFWELIKEAFKPDFIITYGGMALLFIVIFAENGVFFGFFLPGDSLLFTAGLLCATNKIAQPVEMVMLLIGIGSVLGYLFGYYFGHKAGKALLKRPDSLFFKKKHIEVARSYYDRYGGKTLIIGRFLPIVRTFAPILAGIISMDFKRFMLFNLTGALLWTVTVVSVGYFLGRMFPQAGDYLGYIVILMVIVTAIPIVNVYRNRKKDKSEEELA